MKLSTFFKKHGWCKFSFARDSRRHEVNDNSPRAVSFCLMGALRNGCGEQEVGLREACVAEFSSPYIPSVNDTRILNKVRVLKFLEKYKL